ncbi:Uu.00g056540.m01.CDS01 [Anthostomella pinea]|uniref:Uu.00g056540.m01.CDS01 n=1 Tax=Anthostomella pinea TaxID=933095 RepID=A0AAI8YM44_9PEZI|nr:Uu.00g056540.m01.CDS01 [Anthostomella pinea]
MLVQAFLFTALAALGSAKPVPAPSASACTREHGTYDVCDTAHSYMRCQGHRPIMVADCRRPHYCQIINGKGSCNGLSPPLMNATTSR